ncbi:hypothetical protein F5146DRAFT_1058554 [Armillaria mellea]|nr:hypothetical protein F5146DRAFT_1058554 [Armillaria mellea]
MLSTITKASKMPMSKTEMIAHMSTKLSNEYWMLIFEQLDTHDLFNIICTCRKFYGLALRALYRNLLFMDFSYFQQNASFWEGRDDNMIEVPKALVLCALKRGKIDPFSPPCYGRVSYDVLSRITGYPSLEKVEICASSLSPNTFYSTILQLPHLTRLSLVDNIFDVLSMTSPNDELILTQLAALPLAHLTLLGNVAVGPRRHERTRYHFLHLATAKSLRVLRIDWDVESSVFLAKRTLGYDGESFNMPEGLETVELCIKSGTSSPPAASPNINLLHTFLRQSGHHIKTMKVIGQLDVRFKVASEVLPKLEEFGGNPWATIAFLHSSRPIKHLHVCDIDQQSSNSALIPLLSAIAKEKPDLETLDLFVTTWDLEIMHAIKHLFRDLRDLRIKYQRGGPSENTVVGLASHFFDRFVNLSIVHVYKIQWWPQTHTRRYKWYNRRLLMPSPPPRTRVPAAPPPEVIQNPVGLVQPWNRECRMLKEVQFDSKNVLRRVSDGDPWAKRQVQRKCLGWDDLEIDAEYLYEQREHFEWQLLDFAETFTAADLVVLSI